jgi:alpha-ketoglutarate-dependent taurine dioxygenase
MHVVTVDAAFRTRELTPNIGVMVEAGAAKLLSGTAAGDIRALFDERSVVVFPGVDFDDQRQIAFTQTLGVQAFENNGVPQANGEKQAIFKVSLDPSVNPIGEYLKTSFFWHLDGTMHEVPILASLLSARYLPPGGGATEWASTYAAYDALPEPDKAALEGLRVVHANWANSMVIGSTAAYVVGMEPADSMDLLVRLRDWATQPQFVYRHEWKVGDLVMWDNTGTLHRAIPYDEASGRLLHRTMLQGEEPIA